MTASAVDTGACWNCLTTGAEKCMVVGKKAPGSGEWPVIVAELCAPVQGDSAGHVGGTRCANLASMGDDSGGEPVTETAGEVREPFTDDVGGGWCELVVQSDGKIGIAHPRCDALADLAIDLDAFFCPACHRNGRISGAWAADVIKAASGP